MNPVNRKLFLNFPLTTMYGGFDYNNTIPGVQWARFGTAMVNCLISNRTVEGRVEYGRRGGKVESAGPSGAGLQDHEVQIS